VFAAVFLALGIYSFMKIGEEARLTGMVNYWESLLQKGIIFFGYFKFLPVAFGILLAVTQFVPEMQSKRLKLTLHLPLPETKIISAMLLYGVVAVFLFTAVTLPLLMFGLRLSFPPEIVLFALQLILPWFLAGFAGYLLGAWICLEPQWKYRVLYLLPAIAALSFFFIEAKAGAFLPFFAYLIVFTALAFLFPFYSVNRFKEGRI